MTLTRSAGPGCLAAAALFAGACADAPAAGGPDDLPAWRLEEVVRIGHLDDPDLGFSDVRSVRRDGTGRIYVLEAQDREVRVFEADGRPLRTVGSRGQGPGEFEFPNRMGLIGDTLWISDLVTQRISFFSGEGDLLHTIPSMRVPIEVGDPPVTATAMAGEPAGDGTFFGTLAFPVGPGIDSVRTPRLRFDSEGAIQDTVGWEMAYMPSPVVIRGRGFTTFLSHPMNDSPIRLTEGEPLEIHRGAARSSDDAEFKVVRRKEDGEGEVLRTFSYRPLPLEPAFADSVLESMVEQFVQRGASEEDARRTVREDVQLPRFHPPVSQARRGGDGSLWLRREEDAGARRRWTILDPDLELRAEVRLPRDFRLESIEGDYIIGVETDELGVPWVVGYRVHPGG